MIVVYLLIFAISAIYLYFKYTFTHWDRKGFPYVKPSFPFGNLSSVATGKTSFGVNIYELYKASTKPIVGVYLFFQPGLLVRDAEIVKKILGADFDNFHDRGVYCNPADPYSQNLFALRGHQWKALRTKLTPTFTTGKMKGMMPTILSIGHNLQKQMKPFADKSEIVRVEELLSRYSMDIIASTIFGLDTNVLEHPDDPFRMIEKKINTTDLLTRLRGAANFLFPKLLEILNISSLPTEVANFMTEIVKQNIEHREQNHETRNDFIQCLIQLRNTGKIDDADDSSFKPDTAADDLKSMSIEECAAQVFLFYIAGFHTSASAVTYTLYELAANPELMHQLQNDIDEALKRHNGELTYECMQDIPLLELCIQESVRKYPTLPLLNRICTKDYQVPNSDLKIEKGTPIIISLLGMLRDPEYFPEPMKFLPERYKEGNKRYNPTAFIPFGDGPRACIGLRLGKIISKIGIILLLQKYDFECLEKKELEFVTYSVPLIVKDGVQLKVTNRQNISVFTP